MSPRSALLHHGALAALLPCLPAMLASPPARADDLPPPPTAAPGQDGMILRLDLVVNGRATGVLAQVVQRRGRLFVTAADLAAAGLIVPPALGPLIAPGDQPGIAMDYDQPMQRLVLRVTDAWLPLQALRPRAAPRIEARSDRGMLLNYDLYASDAPDQHYASLWQEARLFGGFGVVRSTGVLMQAAGAGGYTRFDTNWTFVDDRRILTVEAGDLVTRGVSWSNAVRLGGVQVSRDFSVRPDVVTYPLPVFSGSAAVPSTVELFINGQRTAEQNVSPGPFTLSEVPFINGAGQATIVTRDVQGRQVSNTLPFYASSSLLRPGLDDHALSVGMLRRFYGLRSFAYGALAASGSWRRGLTPRLTVEAHGEAARSLGLFGVGMTAQPGLLGLVNVALAGSRGRDGSGTQLSVAYEYGNRRLGLSVQHVRRSAGFRDLGSIGVDRYRLPPRQTQLSASAALGPAGTIAAGLIELRQSLSVAAGGSSRARLANLSYSLPLFGRASLYLSANRDLRQNRSSALAQLAIPFGNRSVAVASVERAAGGGLRERATYSRAVASDGGLGWNMAAGQEPGGGARYQADATWRGEAVQVQAGIYGVAGRSPVRWADVSGSVVAMDGALFAANRINDGFALVSAAGQSDVPVYYDHQAVGRTDHAGHLLIPSVSAYYGANYALDPLDLPANVAIGSVEQQAAVRLGSGRLIRFELKTVTAATLALVDLIGRPLPPGTAVSADGGQATVVGYDGAVYLEGLSRKNRLTVSLPGDISCHVDFALPETNVVTQLGTMTCR